MGKTFKEIFDEGVVNCDVICPHCGYQSTRNIAILITHDCGMCGKNVFHV